MTPSRPSLRNWLVFGSETEPDPLVPLRAGPLQLLYDPASGFVRRVCLGQHEVLRGLYAAVRDCDWNIIPGTLRETRREVASDSFYLEFESEHRLGDIHFVWQGSIRGQSDGTLLYAFDGEAKSTFRRNRIGFCVLHPIRECAGVAARLRRIDGSVVECRFPKTIEPQISGQSCFRDLRAMAHPIAPDLWAEVEFDGDVFEMEDQRNWTDASLKTYCTPLALPFPVQIKAGTRVRQSVTLRLAKGVSWGAGVQDAITNQRPEIVTITIPEAGEARCLQIGLAMARHREALTEREIARLRELHLAHLRVDVRLSAPDWPALWEGATREAGQLGIGVELALHLPREGQGDLMAFHQRLLTRPATLVRVLACRAGEPATTLETLQTVRHALADFPVPVGAGSDANFCELHRDQALGRVDAAQADFIFWSINPQVHAFDNLSVMETLEAQADTVDTARTFSGGKPLVISPVTLKPRFNAVATTALLSAAPGEQPPPVDPRQVSLFAAAWTLGTLAALAEAGVESVTLYETTGRAGVLERERGSPSPENLPSLRGAVFPVYHVLADLAGCLSYAPAHLSATSRIAVPPLLDGRGQHSVLLGNLLSHTQRVHLRTSASVVQARVIDADSVATAVLEPENFRAKTSRRLTARNGVIELDLPPHALARIEWSFF